MYSIYTNSALTFEFIISLLIFDSFTKFIRKRHNLYTEYRGMIIINLAKLKKKKTFLNWGEG